MSAKDLLNITNLEFNKMTRSQLSKAVSALGKVANKRITSAKRGGVRSPAIRYIENSGGKISSRGKDINELRGEFMRAKNFLQSKTGTQAGWRATQKATIKELQKHGVKVSLKDFDEMWETYEKLKEFSPEISSRQMKYATLKDISSAIKDGNKSPEEIAIDMKKQLSRIYEEREEDENDMGDFFELSDEEVPTLRKGYENVKREFKRGLRELTDLIDD